MENLSENTKGNNANTLLGVVASNEKVLICNNCKDIWKNLFKLVINFHLLRFNYKNRFAYITTIFKKPLRSFHY